MTTIEDDVNSNNKVVSATTDYSKNIFFIDGCSGFMSEFAEYNTKVDYEELFNNIPADVKKDIDDLADYYLQFFEIAEISNYDCDYNLFLDSIPKISGLEVDINIYTTSYKKIGLHVSLKKNDPINSENEILQHIFFLNAPFNKPIKFKNYIFNILFYAYVITHDFKFDPVLVYIYHKDDIKTLVNIRKRNIRIFGIPENCPVCLEQTITKTKCNHYLCQICYSSLPVKKCPLCRNAIHVEMQG